VTADPYADIPPPEVAPWERVPRANGHQPVPAIPAPSDEFDIVDGCDLQYRRRIYVWEGRIPRGVMTLLPGEEGIGKSTVGVRIMADLTRGRLPGEYRGKPRDVVVMATEDSITEVVGPRFGEAGADMARVHFVMANPPHPATGEAEPIVLPRDLARLTRAVQKHAAPLVWIDSLVTTLPDDVKTISYKDTSKVLKALSEWAEAHRVAVCAPWHLNKAAGSDTALRMMDSRAFRTTVRSVLLVVADPDAPEDVTQGIVALDKSNAGTLHVPALRYRIRSARYTVTEVDEDTGAPVDRDDSCGVVDWIGEVDGDGRAIARDALAPRVEQEGTARQWLRQYLIDHPQVPRQQVLAAAEVVGHSESAIKRAARSLNLHSAKVPGQRSDGIPYQFASWSLPQSGHSGPTDPTDPTGETSNDPTDPIYAGQLQLGQLGQSDQRGSRDPTGDPTGHRSRPATGSGAPDPGRSWYEAHGRALRQQVIGDDDELT
jgi:AAA domain-containing protein